MDFGGKSNDPYAYDWWILVGKSQAIHSAGPTIHQGSSACGPRKSKRLVALWRLSSNACWTRWISRSHWKNMQLFFCDCDWLLGWLPGCLMLVNKCFSKGLKPITSVGECWIWSGAILVVIGQILNIMIWLQFYASGISIPIRNVTSLVACIHARQQSFCFCSGKYLRAYDCCCRHTTMTDVYWFVTCGSQFRDVWRNKRLIVCQTRCHRIGALASD